MPSEALTARDLRTVAAAPLTPYRRGWDDARYQHIYDNPYRTGCALWHEYDQGHQDGIEARVMTVNRSDK